MAAEASNTQDKVQLDIRAPIDSMRVCNWGPQPHGDKCPIDAIEVAASYTYSNYQRGISFSP